jgi:hypothetical protein
MLLLQVGAGSHVWCPRKGMGEDQHMKRLLNFGGINP